MSISDTYLLEARTLAIQNRGVPITYKKFTSSSPNLKTGDVGPTFEDILVEKALVSGLGKTDQGLVRRVSLLASDIGDGRPSLKDQLLIDGEDYSIFDWAGSQHGSIYSLATIKT
ncbi:hypothetical protein AYO47_03855 [Planctomyces sp. SCGC AG-212-M04]|nr:hypothetical protein AYO47_03855 [Planctomyces sp. SCGC AG-212-M04]